MEPTKLINVKGIPVKPVKKLFAALYEGAIPLGLGFIHYKPGPFPEEELDELLKLHHKGDTTFYFDYVKGRVMKVRLGKDTLDPWLYDRDNGEGAVARIVESLRKED